MTKYVTGAVGSLLGALAGAWLVLAPFALAYQPDGADWTDPTFVDFWTGLPLLVVSVIGFVAYLLGLVTEMRSRGILRSPVASYPQQPESASDATGGSQADVERVLLPLVTAMLEDMRERERADQRTNADLPNSQGANTERSVQQ